MVLVCDKVGHKVTYQRMQLEIDFQHSMSCIKRGIGSIHNNAIRDLTANILKKVCNEIEVEAKLKPLTGEQLQYRSAITGNEGCIYKSYLAHF